MKTLATRFISFGIALMLGVSPVLAQDAPGGSPTDQPQTQDQEQTAPPADDTSSATSSPTPTPAEADVAAVIAQWGTAPSLGPDADQALAQRWFREQNTIRARWGVPTAMRDPYLDWQAENLLRDRLGQPRIPPPQGVTAPAPVARSPQSDQAILSRPEFWTVSDDLWQAWLDTFEAQPPAGWSDERPGEEWFTLQNYLELFRLRQTPRFDRYRLMGAAGRVDTTNSPPTDLGLGPLGHLEQIAPGSVDAYQPVDYPDNLVAVVGYDPWINPDGTMRP